MRGMKATVDEVELDLGRYELRRGGRRVKLEKKPMELLIFLVTGREQLVSREDIIRQLWRSFALMGKGEAALDCITKACASPSHSGTPTTPILRLRASSLSLKDLNPHSNGSIAA